jgi:hypothetical protein
MRFRYVCCVLLISGGAAPAGLLRQCVVMVVYCSNIYSPMVYERLLFVGPIGIFLTVCLECAELFHSLRIYIIQYHYYTNTALVT